MDINWERFAQQILATVIYVLIGLAFFGAAFVGLAKIIKFPIRKEIEEDQNTALAILLGSFFLGISIIIAAAVHGGG
jgi:uncharacterized membrane protein YjfL (UPF0719 family)